VRSLPLVLAAGSLAVAACADGTDATPPVGGGPEGDSSVLQRDAGGLGVPILHHEGGTADGAASLDAPGHTMMDAGGALDAYESGAVDALGLNDAPSHADAPASVDAHHADTGHADTGTGTHDAHGGMDAGSPWGSITVVQTSAESTSCTLTTSATRAGTLLVAMEPGAASSPSGEWSLLASSADGAQIFVWPDNPGGLTSFTFGSSFFGCDIIFVELAGVPASVVLDFQKSASATSNVPSITVTGSAPKNAGELELLYLTAGATPSASVAGWHYLGTDGNTNFGWWQTATSAAPSPTAVLSTPTSATIVLANLAD